MLFRIVLLTACMVTAQAVFAIISADKADVQTTLSSLPAPKESAISLPQEQIEVLKGDELKKEELVTKENDLVSQIEGYINQFVNTQAVKDTIKNNYKDTLNKVLADPEKTLKTLRDKLSTQQEDLLRTEVQQVETIDKSLEKKPSENSGIVQKLIEFYELLTKNNKPTIPNAR